jgi:hypothetical protein
VQADKKGTVEREPLSHADLKRIGSRKQKRRYEKKVSELGTINARTSIENRLPSFLGTKDLATSSPSWGWVASTRLSVELRVGNEEVVPPPRMGNHKRDAIIRTLVLTCLFGSSGMMAPALWDTSSVRISFPCNNASAARHDFAKLAADIAAGPLDLQKEVHPEGSSISKRGWKLGPPSLLYGRKLGDPQCSTTLSCQKKGMPMQEHKCLPQIGMFYEAMSVLFLNL